MVVRVVRLGTSRHPDEGPRVGTVRRPPRGVSKAQYSKENWYDVWFPNLAPSPETMKLGQNADTEAQWASFKRRYRTEMAKPDAAHAIELLARLSNSANFSVGCYCEHEELCHRSVLRELLTNAGANLGMGRSWPRD